MASQPVVELPLEPVGAEAFQAVGTAVREEAEADTASWLEDMIDGRRFTTRRALL